MEITDYVKNCMSFVSKEQFLEVRDENVKDYMSVLLTATGWEGKYAKQMLDDWAGLTLDGVLKELAEKAQNEGCEYVTDITINFVAGSNSLFSRQKQRLYVTGTGLIKKQE